MSLNCPDCQATMWPWVRRSGLHYALGAHYSHAEGEPAIFPPLLLSPFSSELEERIQFCGESEQ